MNYDDYSSQKKYSVIARVGESDYLEPRVGDAQILFYIDQDCPDGKIKQVDKDIFKTGSVFITNGYDEHVNKKHSPSDLVLVTDLIQSQNDTHNSAVSNRPKHDWAAKGVNVKKFTTRLIPVLNCPLPNIDTGEMVFVDESVKAGTHFITQNNSIYGPFEISIESGNYFASVNRPPAVSGRTHYMTIQKVDEIKNNDLLIRSDIPHAGAQLFISSLKEYGLCCKDTWSEQDYISSRSIFKELQKAKHKGRIPLITKKNVEMIQEEVSKYYSSNDSSLLDNQRRDRALRLLSEIQGNEPWFEVIEAYANSNEGKKHIGMHYSASKKADVISIADDNQEEEDVMAAQQKQNKLYSDIERLEADFSSMEEKIAKQKKRYEADQKAHNEKLEDQRIKQEAEISNLKTSGELLEKKYSSYQELDEIEQRVIRAEEEDRSLRHSLGRMERAVKEQQDLLATPDKLAKSLVQVHTVMESLGYSQYTGNRATQASKNTYVPAQTAEFKNKPSPADIVVTLTDRMNNSYGKQLSTVEVANLLICTQQHIMTVIKGRPGVGKTSSVIKLAQALGIKNSTAHGDFLNVPVARGWSSSRDILGYYNSLRGEYQASKTGIYEFLRNGEEETAINGRIILLDEGNLSPLEYYLSDFIGICDAEGADRPIITGSPIAGEEYLYPNKNKSLRFMITINSDATVEPLSPRMLDRCPVISMDVSTQENIDGGLLTFDGAISNELLELSFGRVDYDEIETDNALSMIQSFIKSGTDIARQLSSCLYVDGRRENNIKQYLAAAARVFENEKLARDFAVAQFVLPHLNCHGQGALDAMTAMRAFAEVNEWGRCMELLDMVITNGDSYMEHYSFL